MIFIKNNYTKRWVDIQKITFNLIIRYINFFYKNIILFNAAGYGNIGDDLMAVYFKKRLQKNCSVFNIDFSNLEKIKNNLNNLELIPIRINDVINFNKKNTLIICGGGTLINPLVFSNDFYLKEMDKFQNLKFKTLFLGIEATGFIDKMLAKKVFKEAIFVGVRNQQTKEKIIDLYNFKEKKPRIFIINDIIEHINFKKNINTDTKKIGICISPKIGVNKNKLTQLIKKLLNKKYQIEFFSFCQHETYPPENDLDFGYDIKKSFFKENNNVKIYEKVDINETINHLDQYEIIITTRLHVTIIAHKMGIKVFNINWEDKCKNYCQNNQLFNGDIDDLLKEINKL